MDISFSYDSSINIALVQNDVTAASTVIKQTGFGYEVTVVVLGGLMVMATVGVIVAKRKGLFAGNTV